MTISIIKIQDKRFIDSMVDYCSFSWNGDSLFAIRGQNGSRHHTFYDFDAKSEKDMEKYIPELKKLLK